MTGLVTPDFVATVRRTQHAVAALLGGDPEPEKGLWSRGDDITLANPAGGFRRGWHEVEAGLDLAASGFTRGRACTFEEITIEAGADIAYLFELEHFESDLTNGRGLVTGALRVVMIFRLEDGDWKLVHRQADTLTEPAPQERASEDAG
ncbi:MAG: nuclear transport factor 2 family protein [Nakamurella sp.]